MSDAKQYYDIGGDPCSLDELCRKEPAWAANRIRVMTEQLANAESAKPAEREGWVSAVDGEYPKENQYAWVDVPGSKPMVMQWKVHHWWGLDWRGNSVAFRMGHVRQFSALPAPPELKE